MLDQLAAAPRRPVGETDPLSAQDRERILVRWNGAALTVPDATLPQLFEAQAARTPGATALGDLVTRHETLRTVYPESPDGPRQTVLPADSFPGLPVVDRPEPDLARAAADPALPRLAL
ncbi:hypothetical protein VM98_35280, partial [Streptomyces rubellomurinus subsp. indigoferus]